MLAILFPAVVYSLTSLVSMILRHPSFWWTLAIYLPVIIYVLAFYFYSIYDQQISLSAEGLMYKTALFTLAARWEHILRVESTGTSRWGTRYLVLSQPEFRWDPWFGLNVRYSPFRGVFLKRHGRRIPLGPLCWENNAELERLIDHYAPQILL